MATVFLLLIYLTFISLGLPDSLLGAAWPVMRGDFGASLDTAGAISFIVTAGTIVSSLLSDKLVRRFGTGRVTAVSVLATALALLASSFSGSVWLLMAIAVPLGLGAGAVDSVLNNYVALHYQPRHMSWLHSFWGIGAFSGPLIMGLFLQTGGSWRGGYRAIGIIQLVVSALLLVSLPMWQKRESVLGGAEKTATANSGGTAKNGGSALRIPGVPFALITFFFYCAVELSVGLWGSSFLVESRGFAAPVAATAISMYYGGITLGRIVSGFLTLRFSGTQLIRAGVVPIIVGGVLLCLPVHPYAALAALLLVGLGCAPVYPSMIHETPSRFGAANSQKIIGWQMASAYTGSTLMPPVIGFVAARLGTGVLPIFVLVFGLALLLFSECITKAVRPTGAC